MANTVVGIDKKENNSKHKSKESTPQDTPKDPLNAECNNDGHVLKNDFLPKRKKQKKSRTSRSRSPPKVQRSSKHSSDRVVTGVERFLLKRSTSSHSRDLNKVGAKVALALFIGEEYQQHKADEKTIFERVREKEHIQAKEPIKGVKHRNNYLYTNQIDGTVSGAESVRTPGPNERANERNINCNDELKSTQTEPHMIAASYNSNQGKILPQVENSEDNTAGNILKHNVGDGGENAITSIAKSLIEGTVEKMEAGTFKESQNKLNKSNSKYVETLDVLNRSVSAVNRVFVENNEENNNVLSNGNESENSDCSINSKNTQHHEEVVSDIPTKSRIFPERKYNYIPSPDKSSVFTSLDSQDVGKAKSLPSQNIEELVGQEEEVILGPSFPEIKRIFSDDRNNHLPFALKPSKNKEKHKKPTDDVLNSKRNPHNSVPAKSSPSRIRKKRKKKTKKSPIVSKSSSDEHYGQTRNVDLKKTKVKSDKQSRSRSCSSSEHEHLENHTERGKRFDKKKCTSKRASSVSSVASDVCSMTPHNVDFNKLKTPTTVETIMSEELTLANIPTDKTLLKNHQEAVSDATEQPHPSPKEVIKSPTPVQLNSDVPPLSEIDKGSLQQSPLQESFKLSSSADKRNIGPIDSGSSIASQDITRHSCSGSDITAQQNQSIILNHKPKKKRKKKKVPSTVNVTIDCFTSEPASKQNSALVCLSDSGHSLSPPVNVDNINSGAICSEKSTLVDSQKSNINISKCSSRESCPNRSPSHSRNHSGSEYSQWSPRQKKSKIGRPNQNSPKQPVPRNRSECDENKICPPVLKPLCPPTKKDGPCEKETSPPCPPTKKDDPCAKERSASCGQQRRRSCSSEGFFGRISKNFGGLLAQIASNHCKYRFPSRKDLFVPDIGMGKCWMFPPKGEPEMGLFEESRRLARHPDMEVSEDDTSLQVSDSLGESQHKTRQKSASGKSRAKSLGGGKKADSIGNYKVEIGYPNEKYVLTVTQDENCSPTFIPYENGAQDAELISCKETDDGTEWKFRIPSVSGDGDDGQSDGLAGCNPQKVAGSRRESTSKRDSSSKRERSSVQDSSSRRSIVSRRERHGRRGSLSGRSNEDFSGRSSRLYRRRTDDLSETSASKTSASKTSASNSNVRYRHRSCMSSCTSLGDDSYTRQFDTTGYSTEDDHILKQSNKTHTKDGNMDRYEGGRSSQSKYYRKKSPTYIDVSRSFSKMSNSSRQVESKKYMPNRSNSQLYGLAGYKKLKRSCDDSDVDSYSKRSKTYAPSRRHSLETLDDSRNLNRRHEDIKTDRSHRDDKHYRDGRRSRGRYSDLGTYERKQNVTRRPKHSSQKEVPSREDSWHRRRVCNTSRSNRRGYRSNRENSIDTFEHLKYFKQPKNDKFCSLEEPEALTNDKMRCADDSCVQCNGGDKINKRRAYSFSPKKINPDYQQRLCFPECKVYKIGPHREKHEFLPKCEQGSEKYQYHNERIYKRTMKSTRKTSRSPSKNSHYSAHSDKSSGRRNREKRHQKYGNKYNEHTNKSPPSKWHSSSSTKGSNDHEVYEDGSILRKKDGQPFKENEILALKREIDHLSDISETLLNLGRGRKYRSTNSNVQSNTGCFQRYEYSRSLETDTTNSFGESSLSSETSSHRFLTTDEISTHTSYNSHSKNSTAVETNNRGLRKQHSPSDTVSLEKSVKQKEQILCHSTRKSKDEKLNTSCCSGRTSCSENLCSDFILPVSHYQEEIEIKSQERGQSDKDKMKVIQYQQRHKDGKRYSINLYNDETKNEFSSSKESSRGMKDCVFDKREANSTKDSLDQEKLIKPVQVDDLGELFIPEKTLASKNCTHFDTSEECSNILYDNKRNWLCSSAPNRLGINVVTSKPPIHNQSPRKQRNNGPIALAKMYEQSKGIDEHEPFVMATTDEYGKEVDIMTPRQIKTSVKEETCSFNIGCAMHNLTATSTFDKLSLRRHFCNETGNGSSIFFDDCEDSDFCSSILSLSKNQNSSSSASMDCNQSFTKDIFYPHCLNKGSLVASPQRDSSWCDSSVRLEESFPVYNKVSNVLKRTTNNFEAESKRPLSLTSIIRPGAGDAGGKVRNKNEALASTEYGVNHQLFLQTTHKTMHGGDDYNIEDDYAFMKIHFTSKSLQSIENEAEDKRSCSNNIEEGKPFSESVFAKVQGCVPRRPKSETSLVSKDKLSRSKSESSVLQSDSLSKPYNSHSSYVFIDGMSQSENRTCWRYPESYNNTLSNADLLVLPDTLLCRNRNLFDTKSQTVINFDSSVSGEVNMAQFAESVIEANKKTLAFARSREQKSWNDQKHGIENEMIFNNYDIPFKYNCHHGEAQEGSGGASSHKRQYPYNSCSEYHQDGFRCRDTHTNDDDEFVDSKFQMLDKHAICYQATSKTLSFSKMGMERNTREDCSSNVKVSTLSVSQDCTNNHKIIKQYQGDHEREIEESLADFVITKTPSTCCLKGKESGCMKSTENTSAPFVSSESTCVLDQNEKKNIFDNADGATKSDDITNEPTNSRPINETYISTLFSNKNNYFLQGNLKIIFDPVSKTWIRPESKRNLSSRNTLEEKPRISTYEDVDSWKDKPENEKGGNVEDPIKSDTLSIENKGWPCQSWRFGMDEYDRAAGKCVNTQSPALESTESVSSVSNDNVEESFMQSNMGVPLSPISLPCMEYSNQMNLSRSSYIDDLLRHCSAPGRLESIETTRKQPKIKTFSQFLLFQSMLTKEIKECEFTPRLRFDAFLFWLSGNPDSNNSSVGIRYPLNKKRSLSKADFNDESHRGIKHGRYRIKHKKKRSSRMAIEIESDTSIAMERLKATQSQTRTSLRHLRHKLSNEDLYDMYLEEKHKDKAITKLLPNTHSKGEGSDLSSFLSTGFGRLTAAPVDSITGKEIEDMPEYKESIDTFKKTPLTPIQEESNSSIDQAQEEQRSPLQYLLEAFVKKMQDTGMLTKKDDNNVLTENYDDNQLPGGKNDHQTQDLHRVKRQNDGDASNEKQSLHSGSNDSFIKHINQQDVGVSSSDLPSQMSSEQDSTHDVGDNNITNTALYRKGSFTDNGTPLFSSLYNERRFRSSFMKNDIRSFSTQTFPSLSTTENTSYKHHYSKPHDETLSFLDKSRNRFIETQRFLTAHSEIASSKYKIASALQNRQGTLLSRNHVPVSKERTNRRQSLSISGGTSNNSSVHYRTSSYEHLTTTPKFSSLPYRAHNVYTRSPGFVRSEMNASFSNNNLQYKHKYGLLRPGSNEVANWNSNESANNGEHDDIVYQNFNSANKVSKLPYSTKQKHCQFSWHSDAQSYSFTDLDQYCSRCQLCTPDVVEHESCDELNHNELIHQYSKSNKVAVFAGENINGSGNLVGALPHYTKMSKSLGYPIEEEELEEGSDDEYQLASGADCKIDPFGCSTISSGGIVSVLVTDKQEVDTTSNHPSSSMRFIGDGTFGPTGGIARDDILMKISPCCSHKVSSGRYRPDYQDGQKYNYSDSLRNLNPNVLGNTSLAVQRHGIDMRQPFCGQGDTNTKQGFTEWYVDDQTAHDVPVTGISIDIDTSGLSAKRIPKSSADCKNVCQSSEGSAESMTSLSSSGSARRIACLNQRVERDADMSGSKSGSDYELDNICEDTMAEDEDENEGSDDEESEDPDDDEWEDEDEDEDEEDHTSEDEMASICRRVSLTRPSDCRNSSIGMSIAPNPNIGQEKDMTQNKIEYSKDPGNGHYVCMKYAEKTCNELGSKTICSKINDEKTLRNLQIRSRYGETKAVELKRARHRTKSTSTVSKKFSIDQINVPSIDKERVRFACNESGEWAEIGRGSYGCVYLGLLDGKIEVAIKDFYESSSWDLVIHEARMLLFLQETGITPALYGLRRRFDVTKEPSEYCIIMEYFGDGRTLFNVMSDKVPLLPEEWLDVVGQLVAGLRLIHSKSVLINDLKADNILIDLSEGRKTIRYIDVGMATYKHGLTFQLPQDQMNRYNFLAPEVREGSHTTYKSDIYSLGYMLQQIARLAGPTLSGLDKLIAQCTDKNPANRPDVDEIVSQVHWYIMSKSSFGSASSDGNIFLSKSV